MNRKSRADLNDWVDILGFPAFARRRVIMVTPCYSEGGERINEHDAAPAAGAQCCHGALAPDTIIATLIPID